MRVAAAGSFKSQECSTQGGDTSVYIVYQRTLLQNPPRRTGILWPIPPALFPSIIAFRHWAARTQERNLRSAVTCPTEDENFCTVLFNGAPV